MSVKIKSFVKEFIAKVKGDDAGAMAQKAYRQAESALKAQISSLEGDTISLEDRLENAQENAQSARVNSGRLIENRESYIRTLLDYKNEVTKAEEALSVHKKKIDFLKAELKALNEEVDAE